MNAFGGPSGNSGGNPPNSGHNPPNSGEGGPGGRKPNPDGSINTVTESKEDREKRENRLAYRPGETDQERKNRLERDRYKIRKEAKVKARQKKIKEQERINVENGVSSGKYYRNFEEAAEQQQEEDNLGEKY